MKRLPPKICPFAGVLALCGFFITFAVSSSAISDRSTKEYQIKAAYLYNFAKFIEWPERAGTDRSSNIIIGVFGDDPFEEIMDAVRGRSVKGKRVLVKTSRRLEEVLPCDILFICSSEKDNMTRVLAALGSTDVVTVSEVDGFTEMGGTINFVISKEKTVRFEINKEKVEAAGVKMSSKLLSLAANEGN